MSRILAALMVAATATAVPAAAPHGMPDMVVPGGCPGALASIQGRQWTAGVGDLRTGGKVPLNGRVRIGSASKMFVSVVLLQLAGEGRIGLDEPMERYLPGVVPDGERITVRMLLQHTSGLPDYTEAMIQENADYFTLRNRYFEPRELVDIALSMPSRPPGAAWSYSNTNYVLAGLIAQRVTGRPLAELITTRVIDRIGLRDTYLPTVGEKDLRGPHPHGYVRNPVDDRMTDFTVMDPSWGWGAGQMVSTPGDVNTFLRALLDGRLLDRAQLEQMKTTVEATDEWRYGLGLMQTPLSCGGFAWGHGGDIAGYSIRDGATDDGRTVTLAVTTTDGSIQSQSAQTARAGFVDAALCAG
ncbi:serine hydrolase domain-containing protein [Actinoplanes couchii]|uniref:Serine hydrolase n=1 Tax=Actinoplanes couchii TaxID=403638 RepID=A0ABQ3XLB5_9ACTN|nr:serine hydrolase domain-containing protein [Actinoplanes couchii]MDR6318361.1 D-alanyl-D-alanine carboxypeptidase [Actinoplanes couchii]GID59270.1 serine hydrolase [Actinoplanes couchii]